MTSSSSSSTLAFATLLATLTFGASVGCSSSGSDGPAPAALPDRAMAAADGGTTADANTNPDPDAGAKAPPVGGPASTNELTDALGVFVSPNGQAGADGTHDHPLATVQAGIDLAKHVGKRVYVCAGSFNEAITVADSISVIGGLDCSNTAEWRVGTGRSRIEAPSSPAVRAHSITSATRLEGLDIVAPDATAPSGSSIALLADHANALVIARSKLSAGNGAKGDDGTSGVQLANDVTANGAVAPDMSKCGFGGVCARNPITNAPTVPAGGAAGVNACGGGISSPLAPQAGGAGGSGGAYDTNAAVQFGLHAVGFGSTGGVKNLTSAPGTDGPDAANVPAQLAISPNGFVPSNGAAGQNGASGNGGNGGDGAAPDQNWPGVGANQTWTGFGGAGGGAGGCPGLAGSAGKGGGASIAIVAIESALTFEGAEIFTASGGVGGLGSFGSEATAGGLPGGYTFGTAASRAGQPGGRGGLAGVSGNGASGPSIGIAYVGAKPTTDAATKITQGTGGAAINARSRTTLGVTKTVPASPAGIAQDVLAL